jgi:hypothetical protein
MKLSGVHICFEVAGFGRAMTFWTPLWEASGSSRCSPRRNTRNSGRASMRSPAAIRTTT